MVTQLQALQLQVLDKNPGILPVKNGIAVISRDKWTIARVLDINPLKEDLTFNVQRLTDLDKLVKVNFYKKFADNLIDVRSQVEYFKNITITKFNQIIPTVRIKRGLINPLGSLIKMITGNLDNDDAIKYDRLINNIKIRDNYNNEKLTVITEMVQLLTNSTFVLNSNLIQLNNKIGVISKNLEELDHLGIQFISTYNLLIHNFQVIYAQLDEIETSLSFSRLGVLHQSIIESNKLLPLLERINKLEELVFTPSLENLVKIEQTITLKAYLKGNQITYLLEIPVIEKDTYIYYKLTPLPVISLDSTVVILPKYPYLIAKGLKIRLLSHPCQEIEEASFLCTDDEMSQFINDPCVTDLMTYAENVTSCIQIPITIERVRVQFLTRNRWILYSRDEELLTSTCNNEMFRYNVKGTYILTLDDLCEVKIRNITLKRHQTYIENVTYSNLPIVNLPLLYSPEKTTSSTPVNLEGVDLADLKLLSLALKKSYSDSEKSENERAIIEVRSISVWTLGVYILIFVILCFLLYKYHLKLFSCVRSSPKEENIELKEGRVKSVDSTNHTCQRSIF